MFDDKIVISSPGGLPSGISPEEYLNGNISTLRNPVLGNLFFRMNYIEMFGTGIRRIISAYNDCQIKPRFEVKENSITVVLPSLTSTISITSDGKKVIELLDGEVRYSSSEIAERMQWSKDKTIRILNVLVESGYVTKYGNGRGTKYSKN